MSYFNRETEAKIIAHAWKNEGFRKKLLTNPKAALKEFGIEVPANVELKTLTEDAAHCYFVLPPAPSSATKMSEAELEKAAAAGCIFFQTEKQPPITKGISCMA